MLAVKQYILRTYYTTSPVDSIGFVVGKIIRYSLDRGGTKKKGLKLLLCEPQRREKFSTKSRENSKHYMISLTRQDDDDDFGIG